MLQLLRDLRLRAGEASTMDDADFEEFCRLWHAADEALRDAVHAGPEGGAPRLSRPDFENRSGAQSIAFMADILPHLHATLVAHYRRTDVLKALDVGAGSGFGSRFLAGLHRDHSLYSRLEVEAIDVSPQRRRWIRATAPDVRFRVADLFALPQGGWDLVVCSHVVEHLDEPRPFIEKLREVCRGFLFVYAPRAERPLSKGHRSTITEADFAGMPCEFHRIRSIAWHPDRPGDECLLAVIDCRGQEAR